MLYLWIISIIIYSFFSNYDFRFDAIIFPGIFPSFLNEFWWSRVQVKWKNKRKWSHTKGQFFKANYKTYSIQFLFLFLAAMSKMSNFSLSYFSQPLSFANPWCPA